MALTILTINLILPIINENNDWPNVITLVVEVSIGGTISVIVYVYSKRQHDDNQKQSRDIKNILDNIQPLVKDLEHGRVEERKFLSHALFLSLNSLIRKINDVLRLDGKYEQETIDKKKTQILIQQQKRIDYMISMLNIGINYLDMARIFGTDITRRYQNLQIDIQWAQMRCFTPEEYDSERVGSKKSWKDCIESCEILIDAVKPDNCTE